MPNDKEFRNMRISRYYYETINKQILPEFIYFYTIIKFRQDEKE